MIRLNLTTFYRYSLVLYLFVISINILFYIFCQVFDISLVGANSGNDAEVYHLYAIGVYSAGGAINSWSDILIFLNDNGFYNRAYIQYSNYLLYLFVIPFFLYKAICNVIGIKRNKHIYRFIAIYTCLYPGLFILTFDIYRDIFMLTLFSISVYISTFIFDRNVSLIRKISFWIILFALSYIMYTMRIYLGPTFFLSLLLYKFPFNKINTIILIILYFLILLIAKESDFYYMNRILSYRGEDGFIFGDSSLGIGLINKNGLEFIFSLLLSFFGQFFNLYITSFRSLIVFLIEALPITYMLYYVYKNALVVNDYVNFLIIFLILYTSIWVIGTDNVGTAIRLRIFSYFSIFLSFTFILFNKNTYHEIRRNNNIISSVNNKL
jgi:hypothetical protein